MNDFDPEIPLNPLLMMALARSHFRTNETEPDLKPAQEQFGLRPGDVCLMAGTHSDVDDDFTVVKLLDPTLYVDQFPDWQYRVEMGDVVLGLWHSHKDGEGNIGWFKRVKLVPIEQDQYEQVVGWLSKGELPEDPPAWVNQAYNRYNGLLAGASPGLVPTASKCPKCGEQELRIKIKHTTEVVVRAGDLEIDGKSGYVALSEPDRDCSTKASIYCESCHVSADVNPRGIRIDWSIFH